jgi:uncharacterized membrane protein YqhA
MFKVLYKLRYISVLLVVCLAAGSLLMTGIAVSKTYKSVAVVVEQSESLDEVSGPNLVLKYLIQAVDSSLVAVILGIFALGLYKLIVGNIPDDKSSFLGVDRIQNIGDLKNLLCQVIIVILFVHFLKVVIVKADALAWVDLVLPISILILAGGLKLLDLGKN